MEAEAARGCPAGVRRQDVRLFRTLMIDRYTRPKMKAIWDFKHKYEIWLEVELPACAAFERAGQVPRGTAAKIRKKATIDVERIARDREGHEA